MGFLGDFGPLNVIIHHRDPQKAHDDDDDDPCVNPCLLSSGVFRGVGDGATAPRSDH